MHFCRSTNVNCTVTKFNRGRPDWSSAFHPARLVQYRLVLCVWSCPIGPVCLVRWDLSYNPHFNLQLYILVKELYYNNE